MSTSKYENTANEWQDEDYITRRLIFYAINAENGDALLGTCYPARKWSN